MRKKVSIQLGIYLLISMVNEMTAKNITIVL